MTEIKLAKFARVPPGAAMDKALSKAALKVLIALCGHADGNDLCLPTQSRLALVSNLSRQHVNRALQELCNRGWIILAGKRRGRGRWPSNVYRINFENAVEPTAPKSLCHPKGDNSLGTSEVTMPRRPTGDTNKPNNKKREQRHHQRLGQSPYQLLLQTMTKLGLGEADINRIISNLDPTEYESFCQATSNGLDLKISVLKILKATHT